MSAENQTHERESQERDSSRSDKEKEGNRSNYLPENELSRKDNPNAQQGHKPSDEEDSQSKLSKDPTRKNEAQQGESDLRKRSD